jgi:DNA-binding response OmpR family regulator
MNSLTEKTILLVDDEPHMLRLLQFALRKTGAKILEATGGRAALTQAAAHAVDLVVIDFMMPDLDGFATLRELRRDPKYAKVPVIMLTSRGQLELRDTAEGLGIELFLTKPFSPAELIQHVRRLLLGAEGDPGARPGAK